MSSSSGYRRRPLSPHEIRSSRIRQIGFRKGYDPAEVEALLQRLAEEVAARDGQITTLQMENDRLEREVYARRHGQLPSSPVPELDEDLITQRVQAQQYADDMLAAAQNSAAQLVSQSRHQANEILRAAHDAAEQAVREYRANAGGSYTADREELTRLATLAQWAMRQLGGLRAQVDATDDAARLELASILDRLAPMLANPAQQTPHVDSAPPSHWSSQPPRSEAPQSAPPANWPPSSPRMEPPRMEPPRMEPPRMDAPRMEPPRMDPSHMGAPHMGDPRLGDPRMGDPRMEASRMDAPASAPPSWPPSAPSHSQPPSQSQGWLQATSQNWMQDDPSNH